MRTYFASLFCALLVALCLVAPARAVPTEQEFKVWREKEAAFRVMEILYEIAYIRVGQVLTEAEIDALIKENEASIAQSVKTDIAAGKAAPLAYAQANAQCVLRMQERVVKAQVKQAKKTNPLEGFYRLTGQPTMEGYLTITKNDDNGYGLEVAVWRVDAPESFAWSQAEMTALGNSFRTTGVYEPNNGEMDTNKNLQMHITIDKGTATLKTTPDFQKASYAHSPDDDTHVKDVVLDGHYRFVAP